MINEFKDFIAEGSPEAALLNQIDKKKMPAHVAIIMDGNGRWAKQQKLDRLAGHAEGAKSMHIITECAVRIGIQHLTVFAFSSENWKRPLPEVNGLMNMLHDQLISKKPLLMENEIRFHTIGDISLLPDKLKNKLAETEALTQSHRRMQINLALNYGSRLEIIQAIQKMIEDKIPASKVEEKLFQRYLYTRDIPDPDLMIRTSGELRISNFLLYQIAYAEFYFTPVLWPDFRVKEFLIAILDYQKRERRFGNS